MAMEGRQKGITAALSSAFLLGVVPVIGKIAINYGFSPLAVIALRTSLAALLMLSVMYLKMRPYLYIYPVGLIGCILAGFINGLGSILYYSALSRLDASLGHMLYSSYPIFVAFWLLIDRQPITRMTLVRLLLAVPAVVLLVGTGIHKVDLIGALMMISSAILYALHLLINQRILYEAPAQTVTLYTLLAMAVTVVLAFLIARPSLPDPAVTPWWPVIAMGVVTFSSRLTLFLGVKHLGGLQTALLGLAELFVTVILAQIYLNERLTSTQWIGAVFLMMSMILVGFDKMSSHKHPTTGWLAWLNSPKIPTTGFPWR
jgi:drug/metabolite transporter (DMT)-like permease